MKYTINGTEATRGEVQAHLTAEMKESENSPYFPGRCFYNLDCIEHYVRHFMAENNTTTWAYSDIGFIEA